MDTWRTASPIPLVEKPFGASYDSTVYTQISRFGALHADPRFLALYKRI